MINAEESLEVNFQILIGMRAEARRGYKNEKQN